MRYEYGYPELGQSPTEGFDCSGFVGFVLRQAGLHIPDYLDLSDVRRPVRHANEYWEHYGVPVHAECRQPGDLILFARDAWHPRYTGGQPTHIGIVMDEDRYIHSPGQPHLWVEVQPIDERPIAIPPGKPTQYVSNPIGYKAPMRPARHPTYRFPSRLIADYVST